MKFNLLDILALGYLAYSVWHGRKHGFAAELSGMISIILALIAGGGSFHWSERLVQQANSLVGQTGGPLTFFGVIIATYILWRQFHIRLRARAEKLFPNPDFQRRAGMAAGGLRALGLCALVIVVVSTIPIGPLRKPFTHGSLLGRIVIKVVRPAYELKHK